MVEKSATLKLQIITNSGAYHQFDSDTSVNIRYDVGTGQGVHCGGFVRQAHVLGLRGLPTTKTSTHLPTPYSLLPTPYSLLPTHCSLLTAHCSILPTP